MKIRIAAMVMVIVVMIIAVMLIFVSRSENDERGKEVGVPVVAATTTIRSEVMKDIITHTVTINGTTDSFMEVDYMENIYISFDGSSGNDSFNCSYVAGNNIEKGQKLYSFGGKDYVIDYDGRIVNVVVDDTEAVITVLDYDKIYVRCAVDYKYLETFKIGEKVSLWTNSEGKEKSVFEGSVKGIGSIIEDNKVDIYIKSEKKLLPGVSVFGNYCYEKDVEAMFVLKSMILSDGIDNYVQRIEENGEVKKVVVDLGEEFQVQNGDVTTEYVEVFGTLVEGDKLYAEVLME